MSTYDEARARTAKLGCVWPHKRIRGWRGPDSGAPVFRPVGLEALTLKYDTDAHFVPYYLHGEKGCPRLLKATEDDWPVVFDIVPLDCEPEDHDADDAWRANFRQATSCLGWASYETRGGGRALFLTPVPVGRAEFMDTQKRAARLLESLGVRVDPTCLDQWWRCYRLPFVNREITVEVAP